MVWAYDVGKQVIGALEIHFINLGLGLWQQRCAIFLSKENSSDQYDDGQCDWYFLNLLCDTTLGIPLLWVILVLIQSVLTRLNVTYIESGNYFPPTTQDKQHKQQHPGAKKPLFSAFFKQLSVFVSGITLMKFFIYELLGHYEKRASWFANLLLGWCDRWPNFQVFLVMFVSPVALNFLQYFCVDNIIKLPTSCVNSQSLENFEPESLEESSRSNTFSDTNNDTNRGSGHAVYGAIG